MFSALSRRLPADGGPYAYARAAFGNGIGFTNAWSYWITAWAGNAAIVIGWVFYVEEFVNKGSVTGWSIVIALVGLWIPAAINLSGVKNMGAVQVWTTVIKFIPLALMSTVGLFFISTANFSPVNVSGTATCRRIGSAMAICLFSYLGVETAAVAAAKVRDPERNVPKSTVLGTLAAAVVYLLSLTAVFGIVPTAELAKDSNSASYSVAANTIVGGTVGRVPGGRCCHRLRLRSAQRLDHDLRRDAARGGEGRIVPDAFGRLSSRGVPAVGIIGSTVLASVAMVVSYLGASGATVFTTLVLMSGITAAIPYAFSALAQLKWRRDDQRAMHTPRFARDVTVAVVALVFSILFIWYSRNTGQEHWYVVWGPFLMAGARIPPGHSGLSGDADADDASPRRCPPYK